MYTCPKCGGAFENEQFLVGAAELAAGCPRCNRGLKSARAVTSSAPLDQASAQARATLADLAHDFSGELVVWIGQGTNPGQLLNDMLVAREDPGGIPEAVGGVCNAIVTEFLRTMLTKGSLVDFHAEMLSIPERYRRLQEHYEHTQTDFNLAVRKVVRNGPMAQRWESLSDNPPPDASPELQAFWTEQLNRVVDSTTDNVKQVKTLQPRLYTTESLDRAGITYQVVANQGPLDADKALTLMKSSGAYLVTLQSAEKGHAVGFWVQKAVFSSSLYVFIDPNTGVFAFHDRVSFDFFIKLYWSTHLKEYPKAGLLAYALKKK